MLRDYKKGLLTFSYYYLSLKESIIEKSIKIIHISKKNMQSKIITEYKEGDFELLLNQFNLLEHTVTDIKESILEVFSEEFSVENEYKNGGLVMHVSNLKDKGYTYAQINDVFDVSFLHALVNSLYEIDEEMDQLLEKCYSLEAFKCNFILDNGQKVSFDFTQNNNTFEHYTNALLWFYNEGHSGDFTIVYIDK